MYLCMYVQTIQIHGGSSRGSSTASAPPTAVVTAVENSTNNNVHFFLPFAEESLRLKQNPLFFS